MNESRFKRLFIVIIPGILFLKRKTHRTKNQIGDSEKVVREGVGDRNLLCLDCHKFYNHSMQITCSLKTQGRGLAKGMKAVLEGNVNAYLY